MPDALRSEDSASRLNNLDPNCRSRYVAAGGELFPAGFAFRGWIGGIGMRVLLNGLSSLKPKSGIGHYTESLHDNLLETRGTDEVVFFPGPTTRRLLRRFFRAPAPKAASTNSSAGSPSGSAWNRWLGEPARLVKHLGIKFFRHSLRSTFSRQDCDLYHEPNYIPWAADLPTVATIHDLSVLLHPEWHPSDRVKYYEKHFVRGLVSCAHLIADSDAVRREMIATLRIPAKRITTVHLGVRPAFRPMSAPEFLPALRELGLKSGYLLHVGTIEPRKNLRMLMQAYCDLPTELREKHPLALIGGWGWRNESIREYYESTARHHNVIHIGYAPEESLPAIYNGARALLFPSHYEGFGFPPLEMMACGGAVIASSAGSLREILPRQSWLLDPTDLAAWRDAMIQMLNDEDFYNRSRLGTVEHASRFSWRKCADETWNVYADVLNRGQRKPLAA